jgi:hypothetical protein
LLLRDANLTTIIGVLASSCSSDWESTDKVNKLVFALEARVGRDHKLGFNKYEGELYTHIKRDVNSIRFELEKLSTQQ